MSSELTGLVFIGVAMVLIVLSVPIGIAFGITGILGITLVRGSLAAGLSFLGSIPFDAASSVIITVLPLFLIMGTFSLHGGITQKAYVAIDKWLGRMPGGLSIATTWACVAFGATSGSSIAGASIFTKIGLPEMKRQGYESYFALGGIATAAGLALLIPPSIAMIIYAMLTKTSLAKMLMAGVLPGLLTAIVLTINILIESARKPWLSPKAAMVVPWREKIISLVKAWPIGIIIVIVIGGIYTGVFSPTEASAVGALAALIIAIANRGLNWEKLQSALVEAVELTAMVAFMIMGVHLFNSFIVTSGLSTTAGEFVVSLELTPLAYVTAIAVIFLFLGTFMDSLAAMVVVLPILYPAALAIGINPIYFGVVVVVAANIGGITPPFGIIVFATKAAAGPDFTSEGIFRGCFRYYPAMVASVAAVILIPSLSTLIPNTM